MISGKIYKLVCRDVEIREYYVGSTTNFVKRKCRHKSNCNYEKSPSYYIYVYQFIREHGGWDNWDMVQIESFECDNLRELHTRERHWVETLHATLNKISPHKTKEEKVIEKKAYDIIYYQNNVEAKKIRNGKKKNCLCGSMYTQQNSARHAKSTKHKLYEALHKDDIDVI
jgi:hypothetical protein